MRRLRSDKRFGLDCFFAREPADDAESDVPSEYWDTRDEAEARARKIIAAGRFKCVELYDSQPAEWELLDVWQAPKPGEEPEASEAPEPEKVATAEKNLIQKVKRAAVKKVPRARKQGAVRKKAAKAGKRRVKTKSATTTRRPNARKRKT